MLKLVYTVNGVEWGRGRAGTIAGAKEEAARQAYYAVYRRVYG
jgi:hypothetical protein